MTVLLFFTIVAVVISYIDAKTEIIPDKIILPALFILVALKYYENTLDLNTFMAVCIVLIVFVIPIVLNMAFGGGDLRFGVFCALLVGLEGIGYFIILAGISHLLILSIIRKKSFGFAPAMSLGALGAYMLGNT